MNLVDLKKEIENLDKHINIQKGKLDILEQEHEELSKQLKSDIEYEDVLSKVVLLLQKTSKFAREQSKNHIERLVSNCMQNIFETQIDFLIELSELRSVPVAEFFVESKYNENYKVITKPEIARGGGVIDIISIALRISFLEQNNKLGGPLILDEPGKHVSDDYIFNLGEFLRKASKLFDRQIIMVTHNDHLSQICDKSFVVDLKDGKSVVNEIKN